MVDNIRSMVQSKAPKAFKSDTVFEQHSELFRRNGTSEWAFETTGKPQASNGPYLILTPTPGGTLPGSERRKRISPFNSGTTPSVIFF